jgi:hypothetical protein
MSIHVVGADCFELLPLCELGMRRYQSEMPTVVYTQAESAEIRKVMPSGKRVEPDGGNVEHCGGSRRHLLAWTFSSPRVLGWQCTSALLLWLLLGVPATAAATLPLEGLDAGWVASEPSSSFGSDFTTHVTPGPVENPFDFLGGQHGRGLATCVRAALSH